MGSATRARVVVFSSVMFAAIAGAAPRSDEAAMSAVGGLSESIARARDRVFPTLVHIQPIFDASNGGRKFETTATGSGAIIREDGLVVTNYHVAGNAKRMVCTLADRRKVSAQLVGADAATDLALIRLELSELGVEKLACATIGERVPVEGDFVMAMGSPLGLTRSLSFGVVSCAQRYLGELRLNGGAPTGIFNTWIQTDAAINPGNSGGPLVALDGTIVGINSRGYDKADNVGFAIPAPVVREVLAELLAHGSVSRSEIGITIQPLPPSADGTESASAAGGAAAELHGALIASVEPGSPAAKAAIRAGDRLMSFAGHALDVRFDEDLPDALRRLAAGRVGEEVEVVIARGCETETLRVAPVAWQLPTENDYELTELGLTVRALAKDELRKRFLDKDGALLLTGARAGGVIERTVPKLRTGDVLLLADSAPLATGDDLAAALEAATKAGAETIVLTVARGRAQWSIAMKLPKDSGVAVTGGK